MAIVPMGWNEAAELLTCIPASGFNGLRIRSKPSLPKTNDYWNEVAKLDLERAAGGWRQNPKGNSSKILQDEVKTCSLLPKTARFTKQPRVRRVQECVCSQRVVDDNCDDARLRQARTTTRPQRRRSKNETLSKSARMKPPVG
jgi:hypothetical protein